MNKSGISALKFIFLFYVKGEIFMLRTSFAEITDYVHCEGAYGKKSTITGCDLKRTMIDKYTGFRRTCQKRGLRTKQFTKLRNLYGRLYHKATSTQNKKYLKETLSGINYYISFSNRDVTDFGSIVIPYIPANLLRRIAFYDKGLVNLSGIHCVYYKPFTDANRDYTSAKTYKLHVYTKGVGKENFVIRCNHNTDIWVVEF